MQFTYAVIRFFTLMVIMSAPSAKDELLLGTTQVLEASSPADWRRPGQDNLLYMTLGNGARIVFELEPRFAPAHIANLRQLVAQRYFDDLAIIRSQDNYVVQWGDPLAGKAGARSLGKASATLEPEFYRLREGLSITPLESRDAYADAVGFVDGFPVASDKSRAWLAHCYGMLGVGRDVDRNSGNSAELYVVTGHAPRHLDRNVTLIGRALHGMEKLSSLPRGTGQLGFYERPGEHVRIRSIRFGDELAEAERLNIEVLRSDTETFAKYVDSRTSRREGWFDDPAGRIEICNVPIPARLQHKP